MTLVVVGYASPEYAVLATDQMITWSKWVTVKRKKQLKHKYSESTIKATFFAGQYLLGFTGLRI